MSQEAWGKTIAHTLFCNSEVDPNGTDKRYATRSGIAFVAQKTEDGTWHGYPEPWNRIPAALKDKWLDEGKVTKFSLRKYKDYPKDDIFWALDRDNE